jgi:hypothetical protein
MNAKDELLDHIGDRGVEWVHIVLGAEYQEQRTISGSLRDVAPLLDFEYDAGFGSQELFGTIWYADGTWSERAEYDGSEWWRRVSRPQIPKSDGAEQPAELDGRR